MFKVEKDIPIPRSRSNHSGYPFADMEIGDSFLIKCTKKEMARTRNGLGYHIKTLNKSNKINIKITAHAQPNGLRVWRIK